MCAPRFCACSSSSTIERRRAFAHDKAVAHFIEWPARQCRIAGPAAHGFDQIERAERESGEGRFGSARDNDIREIIADVTQSFADGDSAARATVRVRRADTAKAKLNRDVRMRRTAEDLKRQCRIHTVHAFFQKTNVLIFRLANSAQGGAETHANARLRILRASRGCRHRPAPSSSRRRRTARNDRDASVDAAEKNLPAPNPESLRRNVRESRSYRKWRLRRCRFFPRGFRARNFRVRVRCT